MAGGEGSRLRPITSTRPKPLVPVVNRPILWHVLELLKQHDIKETYITLHYLADQITTTFGDGAELGVKINYSFEDKPLGTAGSVKAIEDELTDTFMVISGDVLTDLDLSELVRFHRKKGALVTIGLVKVGNPLEYGVVVTDADEKVTKFIEKPGWSEVYSDTVNTGIYLLEPEAIKLVEADKPFDFSKELFPKILKAGGAIFAKTMSGYWCDVGLPSQYIGAHYDILSGKTKVKIPGRQIEKGVWIEADTEIHSGAEIVGPVLIGTRSLIANRARVGPLACVGANSTVESGAVISRAVVYDFSYVGKESEAKGCVLGKNSIMRPRSRVFEGAVIGDGCQLGAGAEISQNVRIWPDKNVESGALVRVNLVWGLGWQSKAFGSRGIVGLSNIEITPETTAKFGAAFGTFIGPRGKVVVARDTLRSSRMLKESFQAGVLSAGSSIFNLRDSPLPLTRLAIASNKLDGGVYFSSNPSENDYSLIQFLESSGYNITADAQRKIESILFKEEIHRSALEDLSDIFILPQVAEAYQEVVMRGIDSRSILERKPRIVVDCALGPSSSTAPQILSKLGCEVISLNAGSGTYSTTLSVSSSPTNLKDIVTAVGAIAGFRLSGPGDSLRIVDETGAMLSGDESLALVTEILLRLNPGRVAIPVSSSGLIESIVEKRGEKVLRVKSEARAMMEAVGSGKAVFAGNEAGEFIFSKELPYPDALVAATKIVEYLASTESRISKLKREVYWPTVARGVVMVPWNERGRIMRKLALDYNDKRVDTLEGIKVMVEDGWVLINPSSDEPIFEIVAESSDRESATEVLHDFQNRVMEISKSSDADL